MIGKYKSSLHLHAFLYFIMFFCSYLLVFFIHRAGSVATPFSYGILYFFFWVFAFVSVFVFLELEGVEL